MSVASRRSAASVSAMKSPGLLLLLATVVSLPAAVVDGTGGGGGWKKPIEEGQLAEKKVPGWVANPTEGGKTRAAVASWGSGASKDEQKTARADASAKIIAEFKLPESTRIKEMNMWVDSSGKIYILLVAR